MSKKTWAIAVLALAGVMGLLALQSGSGGRKQEQLTILDPARVVVLRTPGGMLEVATIEKIEEFGWQVSYTCRPLDCSILGRTVSRIRVPVHYTYRVPLAESWQLDLEDGQYVLRLPAPEPMLPPTMDTSKAELQVKGQWSAPPKIETVESMLRNFRPELDRRANQPEYLALQRAHAEKTVAEFAQKWMREQIKTPARPVKVVFRDAGSG
ncbi:hypothetical protein GCM10027034_09920 [Ramlibacter solisilvae]|uniref:DUF4230 domain-containing protein n=1 Tax=Ramlibacter tataouinensis TaxID=94132 RepID=A0A127JXE4_9BURK|nr:hypothetical protein [Ramlibacter tataouinensis]AMO24678.1 hypothetical protein UC35_19860 [Ramlibacter tataouinensis]